MLSKLALLGFLTTSALSAPSVELRSEQPYCDHGYYVEKWGHTFTQYFYNVSHPTDIFRGCVPQHLSKRDQYDTTVEPNDDTWLDNVIDYPGDTMTNPHDELIGRYLELCETTICDSRKTIVSRDGQLSLNLDGRFPNAELRDHFLELIKDALRKGLTRIQIPPPEILYYSYTGPMLLNAQSGFGEASGFYLTMRMMQQPTDSRGCPAVVNAINSFGALVPELGAVFGVAGAICGALGG
jgi:hypothetical protein